MQSDNKQEILTSIHNLVDESWNIRQQAAQNLLEMGEAPVPYLIDMLQHKDSELRREAAEMLCRMKWRPENDIQAILYIYAGQQWDSLVALGRKATSILGKSLRDESFYIRTSAALALGKIGHPKGIPYLIVAFQDSNNYVRSAIAKALGECPITPESLNTLKIALMDDDKNVRREAASALVHQGETAVSVLIEAFQKCDWYLRREVMVALNQIGAVAAPGLIAILQKPQSEVKPEAAEVLYNMGIDPAQYGYPIS